jgi:hypothetical protein
VFADSIWVDFWPWETETPSKNLYGGRYQNPAGLNRSTILRHGGGSPSSASRSIGPRHDIAIIFSPAIPGDADSSRLDWL